MKGIELLVGGASVKEAAFAVGYRQPSAFVEMATFEEAGVSEQEEG